MSLRFVGSTPFEVFSVSPVRSVACLLAGVCLLACNSALAGGVEDDGGHALFALGGGEAWVGGASGGHAVALAHWRWRPRDVPLRLDLQFNTDTLSARVEGPTDTVNGSAYARLKGQFPYARMLPDHYRRGRPVGELGFFAGYGALTAGWRGNWRPHWLDLSLTARRWVFAPKPGTADRLRLPPDSWTGEARVSYSLWSVLDDESQWEPHQPFDRIEGFAIGADVTARFRERTRRWGGVENGTSRTPLNRPKNPILGARQWGVVGMPVGARARVQMREQLRWGRGEDDLTRDRLGGTNPWVVPLAGLPWGALVSGRHAALRAEARIEAPADHEFGLWVDGAALAEPPRSREHRGVRLAAGSGVLADLRFGPWKADLRVGMAAPRPWLLARPALSGWFSAGRRW